MKRALAALAAAAVAVAFALPARADDQALEPASEKMWFAEKRDQLVVSASFTRIFDAESYRDLANGTATTIVLRAFTFREGSELPIALSLATFRVVYDLWDEVYVVQIVDMRGKREWTFASRADAIKAVTEVTDFPLASLDYVDIGPRYYAELYVELNPVSDERLAEMRRWLTRRAGSAQLDTNSSFFGSFVSVFATPKLRGADAALRLRSQPFYRVRR